MSHERTRLNFAHMISRSDVKLRSRRPIPSPSVSKQAAAVEDSYSPTQKIAFWPRMSCRHPLTPVSARLQCFDIALGFSLWRVNLVRTLCLKCDRHHIGTRPQLGDSLERMRAAPLLRRSE